MVKFTGMQPVLAVSVLSEDLDYYRERLGFTCPSRVYFLVQGVDAYYAECRKRGAEIQMPLEDRPSFGMRDFRVTDRSGNILAFGEPVTGAAKTDEG